MFGGTVMVFKLGLSKANKLITIKSVQRALEHVKLKRLETGDFSNGHGIAKWSNLYYEWHHAELENTLSILATRNGWPTSMRIDSTDGTLYGFLSQKNFDLKTKRLPSNMHYVSALSYIFNRNFIPIQNKNRMSIQGSLKIGYDEELALRIQKEMIGMNAESINQFCLILLDISRYELIAIKAVIVNENFDILHEEDWSHLIQISHNEDHEPTTSSQETKQHDLKTPLKKRTKERKQL